jgi:hypothetical protein
MSNDPKPDWFLTPAEIVITTFGGVRATARELGCDPSAVSRWKRTGHIPNLYQRRILELAWSRGVDLTAHDLIFGRQA